MGTTALTAISRRRRDARGSRGSRAAHGNRDARDGRNDQGFPGVQGPHSSRGIPGLQGFQGNGKSPGTVLQRAATLFDPPGPRPYPPPPAAPAALSDPAASAASSATSSAPAAPSTPAAAPVPAGAGRRFRATSIERLRAFRGWLYVRCGIEFRTAAALLVVLAVAVGFAVQHFWTGRPRTISAPARIDGPSPGASPIASRGPRSGPGPGPGPGPGLGPGPEVLPGPPAAAGAKAILTVDVAGKARRPGLLRLPAGSRVADALAAAGGALPGTDTSALNLARVLSDGEQVVVGGPAAPAAPVPGGGAPAAGPVSLNSATGAQLETLPGVGPVLAQHILDYRAQHGGFASVDQLRNVTGIGERRFSDLKPLVQP
ncbi:ComEA family DNA-binding protein [Streptomyces sp. H10-C2]|uniref:ComEA family DNA-binding protein n=1 Tax=unclassified Streptomyces TaxID=2593676 RepID=UPI0024BB59FB|nr:MULTISPECIES: ComEA family DNA-binding protein [unclassified Streptomyces]MDJ0340174.1 ComEA family DNA-binding protein [Streptomyces sp. PH10-H1]MDJ0369189.1 ComEA family DNA-binding protein [Streptomyces sp. H10-C2]